MSLLLPTLGLLILPCIVNIKLVMYFCHLCEWCIDVNMFVFIHMYGEESTDVWASTYRNHRSVLSVFFGYKSSYFLRQALSPTEPGAHQVGKTEWPANPRVPLSAAIIRVNKLPTFSFHMITEDPDTVLISLGKYFTNEAMPPTSCLFFLALLESLLDFGHLFPINPYQW